VHNDAGSQLGVGVLAEELDQDVVGSDAIADAASAKRGPVQDESRSISESE
jgi:hypothetical protein